MEEQEDGYVVSYRIKFNDDSSKFMRDYKQAFGVSIQHFVEQAVNEKIIQTKIKEDLGEI